MKLPLFIKQYLHTGVKDDADLETRQQIFVANLFGFIGYSITGIMGTAAILRGDSFLATVLLTASALFFSSHVILRSKKIINPYKFSANLVTSSLMLLMVYLIYTGGVSGTGPLWIYIVPPVALFFGGMRKGTRNLGLFVLVISVLMFYPDDLLLGTTYTFEFKSRLLYSFLTVTSLFAFYENVRQNSYRHIQQISQKFEIQAMQDPLSGLKNRRGMLDKLKSEYDRSKRYSHDITVMMCDIDHFKKVNDQYGHEKGDEVIKGIGNIFSKNLRKQDSLARWGGEEYLFLLPETNGDQAFILAEKLREMIESTQFENGNSKFHVTVSLGIHQFTAADNINQAIAKSDSNLYQAKTQGRNRCILA